jgi:hypothetical protein
MTEFVDVCSRMTDFQKGPVTGWDVFFAAFEQYQEVSTTYIEAQQAAVAGLKESTGAMEHYVHAYELWLNGWQQMFSEYPQSEDLEKANQSSVQIPLLEPSTRLSEDRGKSVGQSTASTNADQPESNVASRERIETLEQRQQVLEETLNEIHREVTE